MKLAKVLFYLGIVLCVVTIGWIILMGMSLGDKGPLLNSYSEALDYIKNQGVLFKLNYINATVITIVNTMFFTLLYMYLKSGSPILSRLGIVFIPVYTAYALFAYTSQVSIAAQLQSVVEYGKENELIDVLLSQLTQAWNKSAVAFINNYAYAILGIPSVLFGLALLGENKTGKIAGYFSIINGVFCMLGIVGIIMNNKLLSFGSTIGGVAFIFFLLFSIVHFKQKLNKASV